MKRMAKAKGRKDYEWIERIRENKPFYNLDHIVKERFLKSEFLTKIS